MISPERDLHDLPDVTTQLFTFAPTDLEELELGRGKDAIAYDLGGDLVYRQSYTNRYIEDPEHAPKFDAHIRRELAAYAALPTEVFVARTLISWIAESRVHKIIEKGLGEPLFFTPGRDALVTIGEARKKWEEGIEYAAGIPLEHYEKLVCDESELRQRGILMDYSGVSNLLYDADKGFTIIDAEFEPAIPLRGRCMYSSLIYSGMLSLLMPYGANWEGNISASARANAIAILQKLEAAGHSPNYQLLFRSLCESLNYTPSYASSNKG